MKQLIKFLLLFYSFVGLLFGIHINTLACSYNNFDECDNIVSDEVNNDYWWVHWHSSIIRAEGNTSKDWNSFKVNKSISNAQDVKVIFECTNGNALYYVVRIAESQNNNFYSTTSKDSPSNAFESTYEGWGYSFHGTYLNSVIGTNLKFHILNNNGLDFHMKDCDVNNIDNLILDIVKYYRCGGKQPSGYIDNNNTDDVYVEPPKDLKLSGVSKNLFDGKKAIKFNWSQTVDLTGYTTLLYAKTKYKYNWTLKFPFSQIDGDSGWVFENEVVTAQYINNQHLNCLEYKWWSSNCDDTISQQVSNDLGQDTGHTTEYKMPDFFIYNSYTDENGNKYYSKKIYIETYKDGTYKIIETKNEDDIDTDTTPIEDTEPDEYTGSTQHDSDNDTTFSINSITGILKDLVNSVGEFPNLMKQIFTFLPAWLWGILSALIGLLVVLRILGR